MANQQLEAKLDAARRGAELVENNMIVGLGSGSTSELAIEALSRRVAQGLKITAVSSSAKSAELAKRLGITVIELEQATHVDLYLDGADEVRKDHWLIKGGGGALTREKILATKAKAYAVLVDETKWVNEFGAFPLPIEILPFAKNFTIDHLQASGLKGKLRDFTTDNGNIIYDAQQFPKKDPATLLNELKLIPGVVEVGLFPPSVVTQVITGLRP